MSDAEKQGQIKKVSADASEPRTISRLIGLEAHSYPSS